MAGEAQVGTVTHYYAKIGVAVVKLAGALNVGDKIHIKGATSDFVQTVESMQIGDDKVEEAKQGQSIGLRVDEHARQHDVVYKVG